MVRKFILVPPGAIPFLQELGSAWSESIKVRLGKERADRVTAARRPAAHLPREDGHAIALLRGRCGAHFRWGLENFRRPPSLVRGGQRLQVWSPSFQARCPSASFLGGRIGIGPPEAPIEQRGHAKQQQRNGQHIPDSFWHSLRQRSSYQAHCSHYKLEPDNPGRPQPRWGWDSLRRPPRGSSCLATLGWRTQSR